MATTPRKKKTPEKPDAKAGISNKLAGAARGGTTWTPRKILAAERAAEAGYLHQAVMVCEWILGDDAVASGLETRLDALFGLTPTFEAGTGRRSAKAIKALEADEDWWESYPESELKQIHTWALLLGIAPGRHNWEAREDHAKRLLAKPRLWYPQTLEFSWQDYQWSVADRDGGRHVVVAGDGEWLLHTPYGTQRPWAYGLWRRLALLVALKRLAIIDWGRHSGNGATTVVTAPTGSTKEQRKELADALANAANEDPIVVLPVGYTMELIEVEANTKDIYDAQISVANNSIAIAIRGGNLSTNVQGGSRAAAETQKKTGDDAKLKFDATSLTSTLHDQSLVWWAQFNFGDPKLAPWPIYPVEPDEDMGDRAQMIATLADGLTKLDTLGYDFDLKKLQEEFGLTFINGRPRETRVPTPAAPPGADPAKPGEKKPDPKKPAPKKEARALASGATENVEGFHDGQEYIDELVEEGASEAAGEMQSELRAVLKLVDECKSLDALTVALGAYYETQDPERLQQIVERTLVLANVAGRLAVLQDV